MLGQLQIEGMLKADQLNDEEVDLLVCALEAKHGETIRGRLRARIRRARVWPGWLDEEDFVQEMWQKLAPELGQGGARDVKNIESWLWTRARNLLVTYLRLKHHTVTMDARFWEFWTECAVDHNSVAPPDDASTREASKIRSKRLQETLETLPWPLRDVVEWRDREGLTFVEIATTLDIPYTTVVGRYRRAIALLQAKLGGCLEPL
jgi:RNA polymerase sigma factor (sigma-70 family)